MPTFKIKSESKDSRVKPRCYEDLGPKIDWNFRLKAHRNGA
jgi:hypothetical protein